MKLQTGPRSPRAGAPDMPGAHRAGLHPSNGGKHA